MDRNNGILLPFDFNQINYEAEKYRYFRRMNVGPAKLVLNRTPLRSRRDGANDLGGIGTPRRAL